MIINKLTVVRNINYKACFLIIGLCFSGLVQSQTCDRSGIRSTAGMDDFDINSNGTVTDKRTGLIWKRCIEGVSGSACDSGSPLKFNWAGALQHAASQGDGWRVPNIKELASIIEEQCIEPGLDLGVFPNTDDSILWVSTPLLDPDADYAYAYNNFLNGTVGESPRSSNDISVRLVKN